mmetsp:Transcript_29868/g.72693  ORF Transcript_29868/g.72693 Transcript_29868/m.72693 type:complete len:189 (+) Transcript_29868:58-624(+)
MALNPPVAEDRFGLKKPVARSNEHFVLEKSGVHFEVDGPATYFGWGSVFVSETRIVLMWQPMPPGYESLEIRLEWLRPGSLRQRRHFMGSYYVTARIEEATREDEQVDLVTPPPVAAGANLKIDVQQADGDEDELFRILQRMYLKQRFEKVWTKMQLENERRVMSKRGIAFYDPLKPDVLHLCKANES